MLKFKYVEANIMTLEQLTNFFMWCTIINVGIFVFWILWMVFAPNLVYKTQTYFFKIQREDFDKIIYNFMGLFKLFILIFCFTPYLALKFFIA